ncbi:CapA family protein [Gymnodinialimonas sp.]
MLFPFKNNPFGRKGIVALKVVLTVAAVTSCAPTSGGGAGNCARPDLAFGGDVLLHTLIQSDAASRPEGFAPAFAPIAGALSRAAVTVVNLEGPTAHNIAPSGREAADPATVFDGHIYSGYPRFNYHPSIANTLRSVGVDVVQTANNHAMDRGAIGADRTLSALASAGLATTGTHARGAPASWHTVRQVAGHNIAFLACSFSTNGLADPGRQVLGCYSNRNSIPTLIHSLNQQPGIDGVVLLPHWGTEYSPHPTARQRALARAAAEAGAIAVVGAHPHVLQPLEMLVTADGRQVPVAYSLGNLLSSQWRLDRRTGAILYLDLSATEPGLQATGARYLPTRVERTTAQGVAVFPAAALATGAPSLAHAQRMLGPGMVAPGGCLTP